MSAPAPAQPPESGEQPYAEDWHREAHPEVLTRLADPAAVVLSVEAAVHGMCGPGARISWYALVNTGPGRVRLPGWRFGHPIPEGTRLLICHGLRVEPYRSP